MKKIISLAAAVAMIFGTASCQKDLTPGQEGDCKVTFNVVIPDDVVTTKAISDGKSVNQLVWEVYQSGERVYAGKVNESTVNSKGQVQFVLELNLVTKLKYDLLFWAQTAKKQDDETYIDIHYDTYSLKNVYFKNRNMTVLGNDETRDAFYASWKDFTPSVSVGTQNQVTLKRPFAQINIASSPSDWERARPFIEDMVDGKEHGLKSEVFISNAYTRFNVLEGDVIGETLSVTYTYNLAPASQDYDNYPSVSWETMPDNYIYHNGEKYGWTAMNYVFAPKDGATFDKVKASFVHSKNDPNTALTKEIISVPFKQNYRTNILGEVFTGGNKFVVVVDASFNNPDPGYTLADPLMLAFEHGGDITLNADVVLPSALVIKNGKKLTLDLNGHTITPSKDFWNVNNSIWSVMSVQGGAELTIKDSKGTGAVVARDGDTYTIDVREDGKLNIEGGTFVGNISSVYVIGGTANISGGHYSISQLSEHNDERFTLNCLDENYKAGEAWIQVTGGSFVNFNPANNLAEGANTNFVADKYKSVETPEGSNVWTVTKE